MLDMILMSVAVEESFDNVLISLDHDGKSLSPLGVAEGVAWGYVRENEGELVFPL